MNESSSWSIYSTKDGESDGPWRSSTSMNAISFGFVATAILISMFLLMAIFEHLFRPENSTFESPHRIRQRQNQSRDGSTHFQKLANQASMVNKTKNTDGYDEKEEMLRQFDMNMAYGPCVGMTRVDRWERALRLGMNPPSEIERLLKTDKVQQDCLWQGRV
ncbi:unnamed protein product [Brassica oleracea]